MKYITTSLLSSFKYFVELDKPLEEFISYLNKVRTPTTEAMKRGIDFEESVESYTKGIKTDNENLSECHKELVYRIGDIVQGGLWQQKVSKPIIVNNKEFMLYGYADVIKENTIYDIKTTKVYDLGKYNTSTQHLIYMYCTGIKNFEYLIAQGGDILENFYRESYQLNSDCEQKIKERIQEFLSFLDNCEEAKNTYNKNWEYSK